jgi:hypothetical protein
VARDEALNVADVLALGIGEPHRLGRRRRHPGQLLHRRERQLAALQLRADRRQFLQRVCDPQPVLRRAWRVPERSLHVREHRGMAELEKAALPIEHSQQPRFLRIDRRSRGRTPTKAAIQITR